MIVGFFSAKQKDFVALMDAAAVGVTEHGARVVGQIVQRRGVSKGGAKKMALPYSPRTLLSYGKVREVAETCERFDADAVLFVTPVTRRQCLLLTETFGLPVMGFEEAVAPGTDPVSEYPHLRPGEVVDGDRATGGR